jgi:hypothetical protein
VRSSSGTLQASSPAWRSRSELFDVAPEALNALLRFTREPHEAPAAWTHSLRDAGLIDAHYALTARGHRYVAARERGQRGCRVAAIIGAPGAVALASVQAAPSGSERVMTLVQRVSVTR